MAGEWSAAFPLDASDALSLSGDPADCSRDCPAATFRLRARLTTSDPCGTETATVEIAGGAGETALSDDGRIALRVLGATTDCDGDPDSGSASYVVFRTSGTTPPDP